MTGSNTGVGKELARLLYCKGARVYVAARSETKALEAIESIKSAAPSDSKPGELTFLQLDLADLTTIKASADAFLSKEKKLHVLFSNAGVMAPAAGSKTVQGYELQLGVNNIGTFMFTQLLTPILIRTAKSEPANTVRVVWVSSSGAEWLSPKPGGVPIDNLDDYNVYSEKKSPMYRYGVSKGGNYLHSVEFAKRYASTGVLSVALNPGNLDSDLYRTQTTLGRKFLQNTFLYPSIYGAYTELFAGLSPDVKSEHNGSWSKWFSFFAGVEKWPRGSNLMLQLYLGGDLWISERIC